MSLQSYTQKFTRIAKQQYEQCISEYGEEVRPTLSDWLTSINLAAATGIGSELTSIDLSEAMERFEYDVLKSKDLSAMTALWSKRGMITKLAGLIHFIRKRQQPWCVRYSSREIQVFHQVVSSGVIVEIDHLKQLVIYRLFLGLPGQ